MAVPPIATPAACYRVDVAPAGKPFGPDDDGWLAAATELHLAASLTGEPREQHLEEAVAIAIDVLGDERIEEHAAWEWDNERFHADALLVLAHALIQSNAFNLAAVVLDDLLVATPHLTPIQRGRAMILRARADWKLDRLDEARERYEHLASVARSEASAELLGRSHVGLGTVAQLRGNIPAMGEHAAKAVSLLAGLPYRAPARSAYQARTIAAARASDVSQAILSGWEFLRLSEGNATFEAEALLLLGQLMMHFQRAADARAAFAAITDLSIPAHISLPALGGLACASAKTGREATVEWVVHEVWRAQGSTAPRYEVASAHLDSAEALLMLGRNEEAGRYREFGRSLAAAHGFHELVHDAAQLEVAEAAPVMSPVLSADAEAVLRTLAALEPERLPEHVDFEVAPA